MAIPVEGGREGRGDGEGAGSEGRLNGPGFVHLRVFGTFPLFKGFLWAYPSPKHKAFYSDMH